MNQLLQFENIPINFHTLISLFPEYKSPKDKIVQLEENGSIVRLKKGVFVVTLSNQKKDVSKELIANHLNGPSYISLQTALAYYNLIPERVTITRSMTTNRSKSYKTPFGLFEYITTTDEYYKIGITQEIIQNKYAFIIATPEKALCDTIITTAGLKIQSLKSMEQYIEQDLRLEIDSIKNWDLSIIEECIDLGKKKSELKFLHKYIVNQKVNYQRIQEQF